MAKGERKITDGTNTITFGAGCKVINIYDASLGLFLVSPANRTKPSVNDFLKAADKFQILYTFKSSAQDGTNAQYTLLRTMVISRTKGQKFTFTWGALGAFTVVIIGFQGEDEAGNIGLISGRIDLQVVT